MIIIKRGSVGIAKLGDSSNETLLDPYFGIYLQTAGGQHANRSADEVVWELAC